MISFGCLLLDLHVKWVLNDRKLCSNEGVGLHVATPGAALCIYLHVNTWDNREHWGGSCCTHIPEGHLYLGVRGVDKRLLITHLKMSPEGMQKIPKMTGNSFTPAR